MERDKNVVGTVIEDFIARTNRKITPLARWREFTRNGRTNRYDIDLLQAACSTCMTCYGTNPRHVIFAKNKVLHHSKGSGANSDQNILGKEFVVPVEIVDRPRRKATESRQFLKYPMLPCLIEQFF